MIPRNPQKQREIMRVLNNYKARRARLPSAVVAPRPTVKSVNRKVKKIQARQELKHVDASGVIELTSDTATVTLLNPLVRGTDNVTRIGDKVTYTSIQIRGRVTASSTAVQAVKWRIIVFRDLQSNGTSPTALQLLDASTVVNLVNAPYNQDYTERFRVISDKSGILSPDVIATSTISGSVTTTNTVATTASMYKVKWQLNFMTNYGLGNAGGIADIAKNAVWILCLSDQTDASNLGPGLTYGARLYYKDD